MESISTFQRQVIYCEVSSQWNLLLCSGFKNSYLPQNLFRLIFSTILPGKLYFSFTVGGVVRNSFVFSCRQIELIMTNRIMLYSLQCDCKKSQKTLKNQKIYTTLYTWKLLLTKSNKNNFFLFSSCEIHSCSWFYFKSNRSKKNLFK